MKYVIIFSFLTCGLLSFNKKEKSISFPAYQTSTLIDTLKVREMIFADYFSPNNDGFNDKFIIQNVELFPENKIIIVSRWGDVVYRSSPYTNEWDGKSNISGPLFGNECQDGVYFFEFHDGKGTSATGKVTLKR